MKQVVTTKSKKQIRDQEVILQILDAIGDRTGVEGREKGWKEFHVGRRYTENRKVHDTPQRQTGRYSERESSQKESESTSRFVHQPPYETPSVGFPPLNQFLYYSDTEQTPTLKSQQSFQSAYLILLISLQHCYHIPLVSG